SNAASRRHSCDPGAYRARTALRAHCCDRGLLGIAHRDCRTRNRLCCRRSRGVVAKQATPGLVTLSSALAAMIAQQTAIAAFPLGLGLEAYGTASLRLP